MDTFELITKLRTTLHKNLQTIGDGLMDGVDNMEKYKAAKDKLNKTFDKTDKVLKKLGETINKNK